MIEKIKHLPRGIADGFFHHAVSEESSGDFPDKEEAENIVRPEPPELKQFMSVRFKNGPQGFEMFEELPGLLAAVPPRCSQGQQNLHYFMVQKTGQAALKEFLSQPVSVSALGKVLPEGVRHLLLSHISIKDACGEDFSHMEKNWR